MQTVSLGTARRWLYFGCSCRTAGDHPLHRAEMAAHSYFCQLIHARQLFINTLTLQGRTQVLEAAVGAGVSQSTTSAPNTAPALLGHGRSAGCVPWPTGLSGARSWRLPRARGGLGALGSCPGAGTMGTLHGHCPAGPGSGGQQLVLTLGHQERGSRWVPVCSSRALPHPMALPGQAEVLMCTSSPLLALENAAC